MNPGWWPPSPAPGHQPGHPLPAEAVEAIPCGAEREWRHAAHLLDDPGSVELMLVIHGPRQGRRWCVQCGPTVAWPCSPWRVATLARVRRAGTPPRRTGWISWPRRGKPIPWFEPHRQDQAEPLPRPPGR